MYESAFNQKRIGIKKRKFGYEHIDELLHFVCRNTYILPKCSMLGSFFNFLRGVGIAIEPLNFIS